MMSLYSLSESYIERMVTGYSTELKGILERGEEEALAIVGRELERFTKGVLRRVAEPERYRPEVWDEAIETSLALLHGDPELPDFDTLEPPQIEELAINRERLARLVNQYWGEP
jgi:hypothetical protein